MNTGLAIEGEKHCLFSEADMLFALPASCIIEVSPEPVLVPMPASDPVLAGIAHLRNEFLPVLQLGALTHRPATFDVSNQQLIVVKGTKGSWGLLVTAVVGLEFLDISNRQDYQDSDDWSAAIIGSATVRNQVTRILNANAVYRLAECALKRCWDSAAERPDRAALGGDATVAN